MLSFGRIGYLLFATIGLTHTSLAGSINIVKTNDTSQDGSSVALCHRQYIDVLAECPDELDCSANDQCDSNNICCNNACGTKTCVSPWIPESDDEDQSGCANFNCTGQGRQCRMAEGQRWCICMPRCVQIVTNDEIVCDQMGRMFTSLCWLDKHACDSGTTLTPTSCRRIIDNEVRNIAEDVSAPMFLPLHGPIVAKESSRVTLECPASGNPPPQIFWQTKDIGQLLRRGMTAGGVSISRDAGELTIENVQLNNSGEYTCVAVNGAGHASLTYILKVTANAQRIGRSPDVDCNRFPSEQARRCTSENGSRKIKKLWVYNRNKNTCGKSYFRDCQSVTNKFLTRSECERTCVKDICNLPMKIGTCKRFQQRFYYDADRVSCLPFAYGGCGGNLNNFQEVVSCRTRCMSPRGNLTRNLQPSCPVCHVNEARAVCNSEFAIVGIVKHFPRVGNFIRTMHVQITEVIMDRSQSLNLLTRNMKDEEESRLEINVDLTEDCPCPDVEKLLFGPLKKAVSISRRHPVGRSSDVSAIITGTTVDGVPTLQAGGFAAKFTDVSLQRMKNTARHGVHICRVMGLLDKQQSP